MMLCAMRIENKCTVQRTDLALSPVCKALDILVSIASQYSCMACCMRTTAASLFNQLRTLGDPISSFLTLKANSDPRHNH